MKGTILVADGIGPEINCIPELNLHLKTLYYFCFVGVCSV